MTDSDKYPGEKEGYCANCGELVLEKTQSCPKCGVEHIQMSELETMITNAKKDLTPSPRESHMQRIPTEALETREELQAERRLIEFKDATDWPDRDQIYCRWCRAEIPRDTETCPECEETNPLADLSEIDFDRHDWSEFDDVAGNHWWMGIVAGALIAGFGFTGADAAGYSAVALLLAVVGSAVAAASGIYDQRYLRSNHPWRPNGAWAALLVLPVLNLLVALAYMIQRIRALGIDAHRRSGNTHVSAS